ncbi:hypothetical protein Q8A73_012556 [Channa argus]|nr:hypothetical protein Q8A73_012556 [Channa argus]
MRTFLLLLCLFVSVFLQGNSGQLNITAHPGQNITLPCQAPVSKDFIAVEWTRSDLKPSQYVFFFRNGRSDKTHQHPSFVNRVDLLDRQMKDGNLSLNLRNVNSSDHGTYECRVKEKERRRVLRGVINSEPVNVIRLTVTDSDLTPEGVNKGGPVGLGAGLVMKDGDASVILKNVNIKDSGTYECYVRIKGSRSELISIVHLKVKDSDHQQITVKTGYDVTLQCRDPRGGDIEVLEWRRQDLEEDVFVCRHGSMSEDLQHPSFKNRVKLRNPEMKDGEVSVILEKVKISDTGTYECYVKQSESKRWKRAVNLKDPDDAELITTITMTVTDSGDGAGAKWVGGVKDEHLGLVVGLCCCL